MSDKHVIWRSNFYEVLSIVFIYIVEWSLVLAPHITKLITRLIMPHDPKKLILQLGEKHKANPHLKFIVDNKDDLVIKKIGDIGFVNYLYLVQTSDGQHSVVIKYGEENPSYEDTLGEEVLDLGRQCLEFNCLSQIHEVIPGGVPEPYVLDQELHIIAMEYLSHMEVLGTALCRGDLDLQLAAKVGKVLGRFQLSTHRKMVSEEMWQGFKEKLTNYEIRQKFLDFKFAKIVETDPFCIPPNLPLFREWMSIVNSRGLFIKLEEMMKREDCLIQMDSHFYSVMISKDRVAFIDFEFGCLGNHAYTLGYLMPFYLMAALDERNSRKNRKDELMKDTKGAIRNMVEAFLHEFAGNIDILGPQATFMSEVAAIFGHTLFIFPSIFVIDLFVKLDKSQSNKLMENGLKLMMEYEQVKTLDDLLAFVFD